MLRNLSASKEQAAMSGESVYDKLRMFNGQAAGWAWYGGGHGAVTPHLPTLTHPAMGGGPSPLNGSRDDPIIKRGEHHIHTSNMLFIYCCNSYRQPGG